MNTEIERVEAEFATWLGAAGAVATGFGRSALVLALEGLNVRGGEVVVPDFVCAQVREAVRRAGGRPVFYRVGRDFSVSEGDFQAVFSPRTQAAIAVHYFGRVLESIEEISSVCGARGIPLIEDCALALGARSGARLAGTFGDVAVFSLTKSDWCYGGGIVATKSSDLIEKMRQHRAGHFKTYEKLSRWYGVLRCVDFVANRPSWSRIAGVCGKWLERWSGIGEGNFYDAGRFDAALPEFGARRARRILARVDDDIAQRHRIVRELLAQVGNLPVAFFPGREDAASFLLIESEGHAADWVEKAAREGLTLRLSWPAYQSCEEGQSSKTGGRMAASLLILEVHPNLRGGEIRRVAEVLRGIASERGPVRV